MDQAQDRAQAVSPELHAMILGERQDAAVAFVHGYVKDNLATWYTGFGLPVSTQAQVLLYDLRGHGESPVPAQGYDLNSHADDLHRLAQQHLPQHPTLHLVGHSMGALIALRFALLYPAQVASLVLVDAPMPASQCVGPSLLFDPAQWMAMKDLIQQSSSQLGRRERKMMERIDRLISHTTLVEDVLASHAESPADLATVQCPVLLVYGDQSPCAASALYLKQHLPQAELQFLPCGHYVPQEKPVELQHAIQQFLAQHALLEFV